MKESEVFPLGLWERIKAKREEVNKMKAPDGLYVLDGKKAVPCTDLEEWGRLICSADERRVAYTEEGEVHVSTVFLGADLISTLEGREPVLFETKVFGGLLDDATKRYKTWEEAEEGHKEICKEVFKR